MSEQNILNPTAASQMNPTYSIPHKDPQMMASWQARSGKPFSRYMMARGMEFQLHWDKVPFSTYQTLRQWFRQYEQDFFSYFDIDDNRYYSGQFLQEPQYERAGNNQVNVSATFIVCPSLPQFQYPSNWGVDSIFLEERNGFGNDLVKLTGTWDHRDKNYLLWSEQLDNAAWTKSNFGASNPVVTANATADPNGNVTAEQIAFPSVTGINFSDLRQAVANVSTAGRQVTFSIWLKVASGTGSIVLNVQDGTFSTLGTSLAPVAITTTWQRFSVTGTFPVNAVPGMNVILRNGTNSGAPAVTVFAWGAQLEYGPAATTYTQTTNTALTLVAPATDANYHGGTSYFDLGTVTTDAAEWLYVGYGFRLWSCKGPDMGIVQIFMDGVSQGTVDLYAAAVTASAVVLTVQSVSLGQHRIKLSPTNTKNASSSAFFISADALEVMR